MKRTLWMMTLAASQAACIEEHAQAEFETSQDAERAAARDAEALDAQTPPPDRGEPAVDLGPDADTPPVVDAFRLRDAGGEDAALPQRAPFECPPGGALGFSLGICVVHPPGQDPVLPYAFTIESVSPTPPGFACRDAGGLQLGQLSDRLTRLDGRDQAGRRWSVAVSLPVELGARPGMAVIGSGVPAEDPVGPGQADLRIESEGQVTAVFANGYERFQAIDLPGLRLDRGEQNCYWEEPEEYFCSYTGFNLRASAGQDTREVEYGRFQPVGAFTVVHAGLMRIGDRGACNAAPESYNIAAVRRP